MSQITMMFSIASVLIVGVFGDGAEVANMESRLLDIGSKLHEVQTELMSMQQEFVHNFEEQGSIPVGSAPAGDLPVTQDWYKLPGFDCGDGTFADGGVSIYHPVTLDSTYPIVSFLHGSGSGHFYSLCGSIASLGIVVVAVDAHVCGDWSNQQVHAVLGSSQHKDLHPALAHVDFSRVGIIGHSEGSAYTLGTAAFHDSELPLKAAVASHGGGPNASSKIRKDLPVYFATGTKDPRRHKLWPAFDSTPARPAVWGDVAGATHMAPANSGPQNAFMAHFLGCYLLSHPEKSCNMVFGDEPGTLCHGGANMAQCIIRMPEDEDARDSEENYDYADPVPAPLVAAPGPYEVAQDYYTLPGFDCGDGTFGDGGILIYFPANPDTRPDMTYPIASFLHGSGSGRFDGLNYGIASLGIVVVAVNRGTCGEWSVQQMHAVTGSMQHKELHPVLSYVDFASIGVIGHSEGGAYTMESATKAREFPIKAAVASHGGSSNAAPDIPSDLPIFFVSGTADPRRRKLYWAFQATTSIPRIFATIVGGKHMYPAHGSPMNGMMAHFLACYLVPRKESCDIIYGDGPDSLCKANPMGDCVIIKSETDNVDFTDEYYFVKSEYQTQV